MAASQVPANLAIQSAPCRRVSPSVRIPKVHAPTKNPFRYKFAPWQCEQKEKRKQILETHQATSTTSCSKRASTTCTQTKLPRLHRDRSYNVKHKTATQTYLFKRKRRRRALITPSSPKQSWYCGQGPSEIGHSGSTQRLAFGRHGLCFCRHWRSADTFTLRRICSSSAQPNAAGVLAPARCAH